MLCVLITLGAASVGAFARSSDVDAYAASTAPRVDIAPASTDARPKGTGFAVRRHVIAGGGGRSTGAAFAITGTIGQADADPLQPSTGGVFAITGGFWPGIAPAAPLGDPLFANGFEPSVP
jgi:hypothetical protein